MKSGLVVLCAVVAAGAIVAFGPYLCLYEASCPDKPLDQQARWTGDDVVFHPREGLQEMPPLPDLQPGARLDSDLWPRILG